jgi:periplasmic divalent cation tolerance protein
MPSDFPAVFIAWTTVAQRADADRLAAEVIHRNLASCVQIDGPVTSHFRWQGALERTEEYRLQFKCLESQIGPLERHLLAVHPYETPEWLVVRADQVGEKYLSWARASSSTPPL